MTESDKRPLPHLPQQRTTFIGREKEIGELRQLLADPACRLLTLIGPGGVGKTRLALAVAATASFANGVYFVPLQPVATATAVFPAIADVLGLNLTADTPPIRQIGHFLQGKQLLLTLDNLEHLLDCARDLSDLLAAAPALKLLVTSREVLNLQKEWLFPVAGLPVPPDGDDDVGGYGAVALFCNRARRVRPDFSLADEQAAVVQICRLVDGLPLALELAAAWLKTMSCATIATEIQNNLHFLSSRLRNVPERHRSMQAVFAQSWQMLAADEQKMYARLSIFRGGFRREAAKPVAGANLAALAGFVDKSLLVWEANASTGRLNEVEGNRSGRYQMHELLRQYAAEQLAQSPVEETAAYDAYCTYYCDFLHDRRRDVRGRRQREAFTEIRAELENVRAAWLWAVQHNRVADIQRAEYAFLQFCTSQGRYIDGIDILEKTIPILDRPDSGQQQSETLAALLTQLSWLSIRLGRMERAKAAAERSRDIFNKWQVAPHPGMGTDPLTTLATLANIRGDYVEAMRLGEESRQLNEGRDDKFNMTLALYALTNAAYARGQYKAARDYAQQAYNLTKETGNRWFMAYVLNDMGTVARALDEYAQARQHFQAGYDIRETFADPEGMAPALSQLGKLAILQDNYAEAEQNFQQSLSLYQEINDRGGQAIVLTGLGQAALAQGDSETARTQFQQALHIATEIRFVPLMLSLLNDVGQLLLQTGRIALGLELLALADLHPASDDETRARAQQLFSHYEAHVSPETVAATRRRAQTLELSAVAANLLTTLSAPADTAELEASPTPRFVHSPPPAPTDVPPLIDPLSKREIELLHHMAAGLQNREIAAEMTIALSTVKTHINNIYRKLDVTNRVQALSRARELHLL